MSDEHEHSPMNDAERERLLREQLKQLRVVDLAYEMMVSLVTVGYQKLGLTEQTDDMRDLPDAHLAIELLRATVEVAERERGAPEFKDIRSTLAQMQLGYVQALRASGEQGATPRPEDERDEEKADAVPAGEGTPEETPSAQAGQSPKEELPEDELP